VARHGGALRHLHRALALYRELGVLYAEADALISLGEISLAAGRTGDARDQRTAALSLAEKLATSTTRPARSLPHHSDPARAAATVLSHRPAELADWAAVAVVLLGNGIAGIR
jgi:hypothetical protein